MVQVVFLNLLLADNNGLQRHLLARSFVLLLFHEFVVSSGFFTRAVPVHLGFTYIKFLLQLVEKLSHSIAGSFLL